MGTKTSKTQDTAVVIPAGYTELNRFALGAVLAIDTATFNTVGDKMAAAFEANPRAMALVFRADKKGNIKTKEVQTLTLIGGELISNGAVALFMPDGTMEQFKDFSAKHGATYAASFERPVDAAGVGKRVAKLAIERHIAAKASR